MSEQTHTRRGRPTIGPRFAARLTPEQHHVLHEVAERRRTELGDELATASGVLRELLDRGLSTLSDPVEDLARLRPGEPVTN